MKNITELVSEYLNHHVDMSPDDKEDYIKLAQDYEQGNYLSLPSQIVIYNLYLKAKSLLYSKPLYVVEEEDYLQLINEYKAKLVTSVVYKKLKVDYSVKTIGIANISIDELAIFTRVTNVLFRGIMYFTYVEGDSVLVYVAGKSKDDPKQYLKYLRSFNKDQIQIVN